MVRTKHNRSTYRVFFTGFNRVRDGFFSVNQTFFQYEFGIFNWFTFPALALIMTFGEARRQWWGGYLSGLTVVCLIWMAFSKVTPNFIQF